MKIASEYTNNWHPRGYERAREGERNSFKEIFPESFQIVRKTFRYMKLKRFPNKIKPKKNSLGYKSLSLEITGGMLYYLKKGYYITKI